MKDHPNSIKGLILTTLLIGLLFGLYKWYLYSAREKSCREYSMAWLNLDAEHPKNGQEAVTGYNNIDKYKEMYDQCMFLQGY